MTTGLLQPVELTIELATVATIALVIVATPLAWRPARSRAWWKEAIAAVVSLPIVLPPTVIGFYLLVGLGANGAGAPLLARVTRRSSERLGLSEGVSVHAQVKGVALSRE